MGSGWLEQKYIALIGHRLPKFKKKSPQLYNFRCPLCGDSEKSKVKARGYLYVRSGDFWFSCHNCGQSLSFGRFLKFLDKGIYESYLKEGFVAPLKRPLVSLDAFQVPEVRPMSNQPLAALLRLSEAPPNHPAVEYLVEERKLDQKWLSKWFYTESFKSWTNLLLPGKFEHLDETPMIVIPLYDKSGVMYGYQGRVLGDAGARLRYITIMLDDNRPKMWGLDICDLSKDFFVLEGPIDAACLSNALASCGGKISSELLKVAPEALDNSITVYDNEPFNKDVAGNLWKSIKAGYKVVIWPKLLSFPWKDVNKSIQEGWKPSSVEEMMKKRVFSGPMAEEMFRDWKNQERK